ncbi:hypothetical protein EXIGLDRAFT_606761 [Exidia glandulosa HHB12029]|uniref:Uncharacterized protein n=1 Tax=Exidia glandulosa HHB12029 TaxID=1314781 RepID=A0A165M2I7_EXIGL|nr:hypothetical protein EXIGLDRAFT_606761 [Exidia glandulosa HHB12029]
MQTEVFANPLFDAKEVAFVDLEGLDKKLSSSTNDSFSHGLDDRFGRGWKTSTISIDVPHGVKKKKKNTHPTADECRFDAPGVLHRSIPDVVCDAFKQPSGKGFHYTPFREYWERPDTKTTENVYGQFYSSAAFIEAHDELQKSAPEPDCSLPRAVAGIFMASDCAHLTDTGTAKIHPFNVLIANNDKYENGKPKSHAVHPVMILPPLPDTINSFTSKLYNGKTKSPDNPIFTHCKREYYHGGLRLLYDDDFWHMYRHGRVVDCADGVTRRLYLRLFVYSADYPEKVLLATIRDGGGCPCPRCRVRHGDMHKMGTKEDMETRRSEIRVDDAARRSKVEAARKVIYKDGYAVNNERIEDLLKDESYVPTENALSVDIEGVKINVFSLLVVDLMHEIELGVWIGLLAHLIRILHTLGHDKIQTLNDRFHALPTFGRDAIRSFSAKVADMSRMTADDYANMLQCAMPCFEGLFPEPYDSEIQSLLFTLARWHSLAKLRMHTDSTLQQLEQVTKDFGIAIRNFQADCCEKLEAYETPKEQEKRVRAAQAAAATQTTTQTVVNTSRQVRKYNLNTIKFHSMPDYVPSITRVGTTDGYTTAINELSHRVPISMFQRTSKHNFESQIINQLSIREAHDEIEERLKKRSDEDGPVVGDGTEQYHIAVDESDAVLLSKWEQDHDGDQAYEGFAERLHDYCLAQLWKKHGAQDCVPDDGRYPAIERDELNIVGNRIYPHARVHFNYTTYDVRRGQDCVTCNSRKRDIMLLSNDTESTEAQRHPFWYARVLGVFHTHVTHPILASRPKRIDMLWVRWFGMDPDYFGGWVHRRLDRIGFVPAQDPDAFGFLDPAKVLRACHLMPAFAHGRTKDLLAWSSARDDNVEGDWVNYYVGRFSDRDIMMRYTGLGVGHLGNIPVCIDRTEPALFEERTAAPHAEPEAMARSSTAVPSTPSITTATDQQPDDDVEMADDAQLDPEDWMPWHLERVAEAEAS